MTNWYSVASDEEAERLLDAWDSAPTDQPELCGMLLDVARQQVMAFASTDETPALKVTELLEEIGATPTAIATILAVLAVPGSVAVSGVDFDADTFSGEFDIHPDPPARYVYAQLQQAQNLWNAGSASGDGSIGAEGYSFTPRPLDKTIRAIIRPTTGAASVF